MLTKNTQYSYLLNIEFQLFGKIKKINFHSRVLARLVMDDMIFLMKPWRQIKGYPSNGQTTHTNARNPRKDKKLLNYRIDQFIKYFGKKRKSSYTTLVQAEYNNRL
jgi:hypothetical protein